MDTGITYIQSTYFFCVGFVVPSVGFYFMDFDLVQIVIFNGYIFVQIYNYYASFTYPFIIMK